IATRHPGRAWPAATGSTRPAANAAAKPAPAAAGGAVAADIGDVSAIATRRRRAGAAAGILDLPDTCPFVTANTGAQQPTGHSIAATGGYGSSTTGPDTTNIDWSGLSWSANRQCIGECTCSAARE